MNGPANHAQLKLRLPRDLQQWLEQRARENQRSQSGELTYILAQTRKQEQAAATN